MAIRVFLNLWTEQILPNGQLYIEDPIDEYLTDISVSDPNFKGQNYYGRMSLNNRPDKIFLLKICKGNLQPAEWDTLAALPGVKMVPPAPFDFPTASVPANIVAKVYKVLDALSIPRDTFDSSPTVGAFFRNLLKELDSNYQGFGDDELTPLDWA